MSIQRVAVVFPGQGSQEKGMGRDLAEADKEAMELWQYAETTAKAPLRDLYWHGDETAMAQTQYLQPAIFVVAMNLWRVLAAQVGRIRLPVALAGHSLGELCALTAAEVLPLEVAMELVVLRGRLMAEVNPTNHGAMAAIIKLNPATVESIVASAAVETKAIVVVANYNTPTQIVVSGETTAVTACGHLAKKHKGRSIPLNVSGAFHSPLMAEPAAEFARYLNRLSWFPPLRAVYSNVTGTASTDHHRLHELLAAQMTAPVQWIHTIQSLSANGICHFIELGPKNVLSKFTTTILTDAPHYTTYPTATLAALKTLDVLRIIGREVTK